MRDRRVSAAPDVVDVVKPIADPANPAKRGTGPGGAHYRGGTNGGLAEQYPCYRSIRWHQPIF